MAGKKQKQEGVGAWIAIVILFAVGLWPIALVMLLVKLFGNDGQKRRQAPPPLQTAAPEPAAAASAGPCIVERFRAGVGLCLCNVHIRLDNNDRTRLKLLQTGYQLFVPCHDPVI